MQVSVFHARKERFSEITGHFAFYSVQTLRLCPSNAEGTGSIPVRELRSHVPCGIAKKEKINK